MTTCEDTFNDIPGERKTPGHPQNKLKSSIPSKEKKAHAIFNFETVWHAMLERAYAWCGASMHVV